jgi:hypothetical protein
VERKKMGWRGRWGGEEDNTKEEEDEVRKMEVEENRWEKNWEKEKGRMENINIEGTLIK